MFKLTKTLLSLMYHFKNKHSPKWCWKRNLCLQNYRQTRLRTIG